MRSPHVVDGGRSRAAEEATGVVAAEERRREVEHVAVDEPSVWNACATVGPPSTMSWTMPRVAEGRRVSR